MRTEDDEASITSTVVGHIATVTISNSQRRNAFTFRMLAQISEVFQQLDQAPEVRVIVIEGAGDAAFAVGDDISEFASLRSTTADEARYMECALAAFNAPATCSKPVIAAISGYCLGGGMQLAAACDIRICGEDARFAVPASKLGVGYPMEGIARFVNLVGAANTSRILLAGDMFDSAEMARAGFVTELVPAGQAKPAARAYAANLAERAPLTVRALKRSIAACASGDADQLSPALALIEQCPRSADFIEGRNAFMQKRKAAFTGS